MLNPEMRKILAQTIMEVQGKMADSIVEVLKKVNNKELFVSSGDIDVDLVSQVLKNLFDSYIDEMDGLIIEYDHQDTPAKLLTDVAHGIERLNKGYINFAKTVMSTSKLEELILQYKQQEARNVAPNPNPDIVVEPVDPPAEPVTVPESLQAPLAEW